MMILMDCINIYTVVNDKMHLACLYLKWDIHLEYRGWGTLKSNQSK